MGIQLSYLVENIVGKEEIAHYNPLLNTVQERNQL